LGGAKPVITPTGFTLLFTPAGDTLTRGKNFNKTSNF